VLGNTIQQRGKLDKHVRTSRSQIGNVFQQFNLVSRLSVLTNVMIGGLCRIPSYRSLLGWFTAEEKHMALEALERVGLKNVALKKASELSGGQQQRVAIARALMQKAKIILADEPIASLDPESSRIVMQLLKDINEKDGITVVVTLHQVDYAQKYCQRAVALQDGEVFFDQPIQHLDEQQLADLYGSQQEASSISDLETTDLNVTCLNGLQQSKSKLKTPEENHAMHH
jgi:phosphonate transport system ATP-binding protein